MIRAVLYYNIVLQKIVVPRDADDGNSVPAESNVARPQRDCRNVAVFDFASRQQKVNSKYTIGLFIN